MQSSSPSYPLLASLDAARAAALCSGAFDACLEAGDIIREGLHDVPGLSLLSEHLAGACCRQSVVNQAWEGLHAIYNDTSRRS